MSREESVKSVRVDSPDFGDVAAIFLKQVSEVHGVTTMTVYRELRAQEASLMQALGCEYPQAAEQSSVLLTQRIHDND